jgi:superkiller protein 3
MIQKTRWQKAAVSVFLVWTFLIGSLPQAHAQDLIPVSDITGGSSVFVFRSSRKAPPKKFVPKTVARRSKAHRAETARKVTRQFTVIAKVAPRRTRLKTVDPHNMPPSPNTMPKEEAAKVFAGVGEYYIDRQETDSALEFFREAVTLDAQNKDAQMGLSEALALKGNQALAEDKADAAKRFYEESIKYNPKNAVAYYGLGEVYDDLNKEDDALANYEKALGFDKDLTEIYAPLGIIYYQKGEIAKADEYLSKAVAASPESTETQYFLGLIRYSQNRNDEALKAFQQAIKGDKDSAEAHFYAGKALMRLNRNQEAMDEFREALRLKPKYFEAFFDLGAANYETENYPEAVNNFKEATRLKNDSIEAYSNLGDAYRQVGNFNDAEASYNLAATFINRDKTYSREDAAQIYSYAGYVIGRQCEFNAKRGIPCRWGTAIGNFEKAIELSPNAADYTNLGWAYYNAAKFDLSQKKEAEGRDKLGKAKDALQRAVAMNPSYIEAPLLNLGVAQIDLGEYDAAIGNLQQVAAKRPDWNFTNYAIGVAYRKSGNLDNAIKWFRKAVDKDPNYVAAWSGLGESEFRNNNKKETERVIGKLRQLKAVGEAKKLEILITGAGFVY